MKPSEAKKIAARYNVRELFTRDNPKTAKGRVLGYTTAVLHLAPYTVAGRNICAMAEEAGCWMGCLNVSGLGGIQPKDGSTIGFDAGTVPDNVVQRARINRTRFYHEERGAFMVMLAAEIRRHVNACEKAGVKPAIRLNGTSDIRWERGHLVEHEGVLYQSIFHAFPEVQFYDYTKIPNRRGLPANYHLTWSYSEASERYAARAPEGLNHAVVFRVPKGQPLPETFNGRRVIDGDTHDLRFLDPDDVVVGLRAKGAGIKDDSGFVIDI